MSDGYRGGSSEDVVSILLQTIEAASAAPAFVVMKMRPPLVPAQTTLLSEGAGASIAMCPPDRSSPHGYGGGQATVQGAVGVAAGGQKASGPYVRRPRWPGSPIAFQSSQTSIGRSYVPFSLMSPSPFQVLQCCFTLAYGKAGLTPPFSERKTCSRPVNISFETFGWKIVGALKATSSRSYRNGFAPAVRSVSAIQNTACWFRGSSRARMPPFCDSSAE